MGNLFFSKHQNVFICCYRCFISLITLFFCEICEYSCTIPNSGVVINVFPTYKFAFTLIDTLFFVISEWTLWSSSKS